MMRKILVTNMTKLPGYFLAAVLFGAQSSEHAENHSHARNIDRPKLTVPAGSEHQGNQREQQTE
jgi:hypothetical protein